MRAGRVTTAEMPTASWQPPGRPDSKIDFVLVTHFHSDHVGGAPQLAGRIPIGRFIDHGENPESNDAPTVQVWQSDCWRQKSTSGSPPSLAIRYRFRAWKPP